MCTDFIDLNKACPKYCYTLPHIDKLIDSILTMMICSRAQSHGGRPTEVLQKHRDHEIAMRRYKLKWRELERAEKEVTKAKRSERDLRRQIEVFRASEGR